MPVVTGAFHCRLVIHKAMSVHILWWNYTSKSTAEYANPIFAIGCISPSSTCHGDLAVKPRSPPEDQNFALQSGQIPVVRAPQAPTGISCPEQPGQGDPHPCTWVRGTQTRPEPCWRYTASQSCSWLFPHHHWDFPDQPQTRACELAFCRIADS